jgi:DNA polymerase III subunit alpha
MMRYPDLVDCCSRIEKTNSSHGVHPAGIVICKNNIYDHVPLKESKGQIASQFTGPEVESLGLLKFDFLALKTLTVVEDTLKRIKERHGLTIDVDKLEPNDKKVFGLFNGMYGSKMDNRGIFQFESYNISKMVKNIRIDTFEDLIVSNALYRPGPLEANVPEIYADYKHGRKKIVYSHPLMESVLKDTYGLMVYQENFMKVSQVLANFTKGQSDTLRKVVGKKKPELIKKEKLDEKFVAGCVKNGIGEAVAKEIFQQIEYFGGYGFNRSHSAAYSFLAYQTAWLKIYYPLEFMSSLMSSEIGSADKGEKMDGYLKECKNMDIVVLQPNINKSKMKFTIEDMIDKNGNKKSIIRHPLTGIDGVGEAAAQSIIENQKYKDLKDFVSKINGSKVNTRVFQALVDTGCFDDEWNMKRAEILASYESLKNTVSKEKVDKKKQEKYIEEHGGGGFLWLGGEGSEITL